MESTLPIRFGSSGRHLFLHVSGIHLYIDDINGTSISRQLRSLFNPSVQNVFSIALQTPAHGTLAWSTFHSLLALALHYFLLCLAQIRSSTNVDHLQGFGIPKPLLDYPVLALLYSATAISPIACLLSGRAWPTTLWWSCSLVLTVVIETMGKSIAEETRGLVELETKKYTAPNA